MRVKMRLCQWSPDAKTIMLATDSGEILFYDLFGNYLVCMHFCAQFGNYFNTMTADEMGE